ncbi:Coatomer subunit gamma-2 [Olea europaea subsp. europaea]|uniref:Coatomer subunit gamma-2 n=1 Tax=Olea europaea subsp. europaea TaxID=158383 RepID=A0A8S0T407_OLEEU|nr:Coatomer subunit gamma-2 [Olea europaea subsp. europaea]
MLKVGVTNFRNAWESMGPDCERIDEYDLGTRESLAEAVNAVIQLLGMQPCEARLLLLCNVNVLARISLGIDGAKEVAMKLTVRSEDENVSDAIHETVASG